MKTFVFVATLIVLLFVFAAPVMAQTLPDTAVDALEKVGVILVTLGAALAGYLGFTVTGFLKSLFPFLDEKTLGKFNDLIIRVVAVASAELSALTVSLLMNYAIQLDETGLWKAIVTIVLVIGAPVFGEIFHRARKATV